MRTIPQSKALVCSIGRTPFISGWLLLLWLAVPTAAALAVPGDLDPSFGDAGKVITDFGPGSNQAFALAIQPDGKIVAVGSSGSDHFALARYNLDGVLDPSFGAGGKAIGDLGGYSEAAYGLAIQPDGKIVAVGTTAPGGYCCRSVIARFGADGAQDGGFGNGGKVYVDFEGGIQQFSAVALQPDGKVVAAGSGYSPFYDVFAIARLLPDGTLDPSFDGDGKVSTDFGGGDAASALAIQSDGKIVAAGRGGPAHDFALARYLPDGRLDPNFGAAGKVLTDLGGFDGAAAVGIQQDGKIVAGGSADGRLALVRYNSDGSVDASFGDNGRAVVQFTGDNLEEARGLAIQSDGRIVAVGRAFVGFDGRFALARFTRDGNLDASFGSAGKVLTDFGPGDDGGEDVILDGSDRIVVAGGSGPCTPLCGFALARYLNAPSSVEVSVDIKPGSAENTLNPSSHGVVPVAILTTDEFDAPLVDPGTVCFGSADDPSRRDCTEAHRRGHVEDVNGDGRTDLVLHFEMQETGIVTADVRACLTGRTFGGLEFHGCSPLQVRPALRPSGEPAAGGDPVAYPGMAGEDSERSAAGSSSDAAGAAPELLGVDPVSGPSVECRVRFRLISYDEASLWVFDLAGRKVASRDLGSLGPGFHEATLRWDRGVGTSIYWVRLEQRGRAVSKRVLLFRQ